MGLDQYAYSKDENGEEDAITDWRKHNRLQGWMEELWESKGKPFDGELEENPMGDFNCVPVELTLTDLEQLEAEVVEMTLPSTCGFFFGGDSFEWTKDDGSSYEEGDYYYKEKDMQFIEDARSAIQQGKKVFYNCWW